MDEETILRRLAASGVIEETDGRVTLTDAYRNRREELADGDGAPSRPDWLSAALVEEAVIDDVDAIVNALTIEALVDEMDPGDIVAAAVALDRIENPPTASGAPEEFVPLHQDDLSAFLERHRASVVFVWKEGSSSCSEMAETLSGVHDLEEVDDSVGLGSICVDDGADLLRERYDVGVLPTTLFFVGETVDVRLHGVREFESVRREVRIVTDEATADTA